MEVLPFTSINYTIPEDSEWEYTEYAETEESSLIEALSRRLEAELRTAKRTHLSVGEVLLPNGLTRSIAQDMFQLADSEPCGLRGCTLYINFEADALRTRLSTIKCDPTTPSTFEKDHQGGTVMISPEYGLQKKKLYRSTSD
ncbi:hypothetical protein NQ317_011478 [Molorchus minor]|uniref:Uncharacterized protein n=1 Tax=Molorchus minor TaxID=1323400 RepID=A0ABQ9JMC2_9CUCU|nr:hypothetical protein NQ317_011478 [Molorchus minor]